MRLIYEDSSLVIIDKPTNFHSHAPENKNIKLNKQWDATFLLRRQLNLDVFPVHRLDRQTSGLLIFAKNKIVAKELQKAFREQAVKKTYFAFVRGEPKASEFIIDRPLKSSSEILLSSVTRVKKLISVEFPFSGQGNKEESLRSRVFSLLELRPQTGRFHQIRRHLAGESTPVMNDKAHGDRKLNLSFQRATSLQTMYLRAMCLEFRHPVSGEVISVKGRWSRPWHYLFDQIGFCALVPRPPDL